jgi:hypothetical protein
MDLRTDPNLESPDEFYEALIECHRGLSSEASHALNARLVLLLANHVGTLQVLKQALDAARAGASERFSPEHAPAGPN